MHHVPTPDHLFWRKYTCPQCPTVLRAVQVVRNIRASGCVERRIIRGHVRHERTSRINRRGIAYARLVDCTLRPAQEGLYEGTAKRTLNVRLGIRVSPSPNGLVR